jgi:hypothetical protein
MPLLVVLRDGLAPGAAMKQTSEPSRICWNQKREGSVILT